MLKNVGSQVYCGWMVNEEMGMRVWGIGVGRFWLVM